MSPNLLPPEGICLAVATRDRAAMLERYLLPALRRAAEAGFEVLVVDQSSDGETERLLADLPAVRRLASPLRGLSHARNVAIAETSAPLIAFTDDDVTPPDGWLERIAGEFARAPEAGAVCGRGLTPSGRELPGRVAGTYRWPTNPFGLGSGFNIAFRRRALDDVGGFDEELGAGSRFRAAEDSDMLYRLLRAGWAVVCSDAVTVVHHDWRSGREETIVHFGYGVGAGAQTARHIAAGDRAAARIAVKEALNHARTFIRAVVTMRFALAVRQVAFVSGMTVGFWRRRRSWNAGYRTASRT